MLGFRRERRRRKGEWRAATVPALGLLAACAAPLCAAQLEPQTNDPVGTCSADEVRQCSRCCEQRLTQYNCTSNPGLQSLTPGMYAGVKANYLSYLTSTSSPNFPVRAKEFEACTGGKIAFAEADNVWEDPIADLGTRTARGAEFYDAYFMSYSHFPEASALDLAETLNARVREDNDRLKWEDVLPQVRGMGEYKKDGETRLDFLMYDGDFFVPIVRLDLLEKHDIPLPNTWEEVLEIAKFFNGTDLNDDSKADDYGFCHFPRQGAGAWDWWWPEALYGTWASYGQTRGTKSGFFFDSETFEPLVDDGFREAAKTWKELWIHGSDGCDPSIFGGGRCAIGLAPPGCWKGVFLNPDGVHRKDEDGNVVWQPKMKNGDYAVPYRFKPPGSTRVVDRDTGELVECTEERCNFAEPAPMRGHLDDKAGDVPDRADLFLPESPLAGRLVNRAPFYWSGGLGTLIRKSAPEVKKNMMWDFFVYTNSPDTSIHDVASYASWLDSWRRSQLQSQSTFVGAGWSKTAYQEHRSVMEWALAANSNGALNLRIPGLVRYTRDVVGEQMKKYIADDIGLDGLVTSIRDGWIDVTDSVGKLDQLEIYRAALDEDGLSEYELCTLHRELMDAKDPSICRKYDPSVRMEGSKVTNVIVPAVVSSVVVVGLLIFGIWWVMRTKADSVWSVKSSELRFDDPPEILGRGTFGLVLLAEYRGTQVAVKRVIPPKIGKQRRSELRTTLFGWGDRGGAASSATKKKAAGPTDLINYEDGSAMNPHDSGNAKKGSAEAAQADSDKEGAVDVEAGIKSADGLDSSGEGEGELKSCEATASTSKISMDSAGNLGSNGSGLKSGSHTKQPMPKRLSWDSNIVNISTRRLSDDAGSTNPGLRSGGASSVRSIASGTSTEFQKMKRRLSNESEGADSGMYSVNGSVQHGAASGTHSHNGSKSGSGKDSILGMRLHTNGGRFSRWVDSCFGRRENEYARLKADFIVEMRHLSKLRHPCITTVMGAVISKKEEPLLVMEYMDHGSLYDLLHNDTYVLEGEVLLPILRDIAQGVRFLHASTPQVIHGDLKAQNILVDSKFRAKVADFGLSQKKQVGVSGTPFWMAPELLRFESRNTAASDVYSFGIILYEVYARRDPYDGEDYERVIQLICDTTVNKRPPVPPAMPQEVASLLMSACLLANPEERPTFDELDLLLKRFQVANVEPSPAEFSKQLKPNDDSKRAARNANLLDEIFPKHIAEALSNGRKVEPEHYDCVTIFFSDIVGYTVMSGTMTPMKVSDMLDRLYFKFDALSHRHEVFKMETIGDAWMGVTNIGDKQKDDHVKRMAEFSLDAIQAANETLIDTDDPSKGFVQIRVGFHTGPVLANVVGSRLPKYSVFGDTVNTASRMESHSWPGKIQCSDRAAALLKIQAPNIKLAYRGEIAVKGKGDMNTYWVVGKKEDKEQ